MEGLLWKYAFGCQQHILVTGAEVSWNKRKGNLRVERIGLRLSNQLASFEEQIEKVDRSSSKKHLLKDLRLCFFTHNKK